MAKIKIKQIDNSAASSSDVITYNGTNNVWAPPQQQNLFETFNLAGTTVGDTAIVADTATDTITFTGGTDISLTGSAATDTITINFVGTVGDPDQNLWATFNGDAGTTTANTITDTFIINGGSGISTSIVGDTLTITNTSPGGVQNLFETMALSGNTAGDLAIVADSTTDTLTFVGGTDIQLTGSATTDTITIDFTGTVGDPDQNIWETINADTGSTTANTTTDTLTIAGGTNVTTSITGDTLTIDASGGGGLTVVTTYAGLPGSPSTNDLVYYTPFNSVMTWDGTDWCGPKVSLALFGREGTGNGNVWLHSIGRSEGHPQGGTEHGYVMPNIISGSGGSAQYKFTVLTGGVVNPVTGDLQLHTGSAATPPAFVSTGVIKATFAAQSHVTAESTPARLVDGGDTIQCHWKRTGGQWQDWVAYATYCLVAGA